MQVIVYSQCQDSYTPQFFQVSKFMQPASFQITMWKTRILPLRTEHFFHQNIFLFIQKINNSCRGFLEEQPRLASFLIIFYMNNTYHCDIFSAQLGCLLTRLDPTVIQMSSKKAQLLCLQATETYFLILPLAKSKGAETFLDNV